MEKLGTKELKEVISFGLAGYKAYKAAVSDGKIGLEDLSQLMALVPVLGPAFENISQVPKELADLDKEEAAEIMAFVSAALPGLEEQEKLYIVSAVLKSIVAIIDVYKTLAQKKVDPVL